MGLLLVDDLMRGELPVLFILHIAQKEDEIAGLTRLQSHLDAMRSDGTPAVGDTVSGGSGSHRVGQTLLAVKADKGFPVGVEAADGLVDMVEREMIAALPILGLVIDSGAFDLNLTGGEVPLEVLHVGGGVPKTPFLEGEELQLLDLGSLVAQRQLLYFAPFVQRHKEKDAGLHAILAARDAGIVHSVAAFVEVQRRAAGLPARIPHRFTILDVEVTPVIVHGNVVVTIAGEPAKLGIFVETIASDSV